MTTDKDPYLVLLDTQIKALSQLSDVDLGCRIGAQGHNWRQVQPDWDPKLKGVQAMAKQCVNCKTIVRANVSARYGEYLAKPVYEYPAEYQLPSTGERIRPQAVRAAWAKKMKAAMLPEIEPIDHHPVPAE